MLSWLRSLHFHKCRSESDETGYWGECVVCGKRFGFVDKATMRAYVDEELRLRGIR